VNHKKGRTFVGLKTFEGAYHRDRAFEEGRRSTKTIKTVLKGRNAEAEKGLTLKSARCLSWCLRIVAEKTTSSEIKWPNVYPLSKKKSSNDRDETEQWEPKR